MELTELVFKVVTDDLDKATAKVKELGQAVKDFNKAQDGKSASDREAAAATKALAKEQRDAAKAAEKAAAAQKKAAEAAADAAEEMSPVEKLLQKLNNQYGDLVAGFTKGEAAILQQARSFGLAESELKPFIAVLEKIKELTKDPFDASIGSIRSVTQEFDRLQQRANLTAQGISLTTKQLAEYSRLSAEVAGQVRVSGLSPTDSGKGQELYNRLLAESQKEYLDVAASVNKLEMAEKERNNALRESERLIAAAERAEQNKAKAAEDAANRIKNANLQVIASAERVAQITSMIKGGMSEAEATKRFDLSSRGVDIASVERLINAEKERNLLLTETKLALAATEKAEEARARAAEAAANRIKNANLDVLASAQRIAQITSMVKGGMSESEASKRVDLSSRGVDIDSINKLIAAENELASTRVKSTKTTSTQDASTRELAKATKWVATEEEKMISVLKSLNEQQDNASRFNEKAARSIFNYEQNLKKSGITGQEAAAKLEVYKKQQKEILSLEQKRQAEYLKRGLQPQIGDVAISLASGQNPLTVLLQQGDQIRGLIAQTGISGELLKKTMRSALADTVVSIKETAVAMGSLLGGSVVSAGRQIAGLVTGPVAALITGFKESQLEGKSLAEGVLTVGQVFSKAFSAAGASALAALPVLLTTAAAAFVAFGVAQYQVIKEQRDLSIALNMTGGALAMSRDQALEFVSANKQVGVSTTQGIQVLTEMAKAGELSSESYKLIAESAVNMEKAAGISIDKTVAEFKKMQEKPVESLTELARATGLVPPAVLDTVASLVEQGKAADASALAIKTLADVNKERAANMIRDLSPIEALWKTIKENVHSAWEEFKRIGEGVTIAGALRTAWQTVAVIASEVWYVLKQTGNEIGGIAAQIAAVARGDFKGAVSIGAEMKADAEAARKAQDELVKKILSGADAQNTQANAAARTSAEIANNVKYAQQFTEKQKLMNEQEKIRAGLDEKKLTRMQAMDKAEADARKRVKTLSEPEVATIRETAGMQWDAKHKNDNTKAQNELNKALDMYADIQNRAIGVNADFNNKLSSLQLLLGKNKISISQYVSEVQLLLDQQPYATKAKKDEEASLKALQKAQETYNDLLNKSSGFTSSYNNEVADLDLLLKNGKITWLDYEVAFAKLLEKQPYYIKLEKDAADATKARAAAQENYNDIMGISSGLSSDFNNKLEKLKLSYSLADISAEAYAEAVLKLLAQQPYAVKLLKEEEAVRKSIADALEKQEKELKKLTDATNEYYHSLQKSYEELLLEKDLIGLSEEERTRRLETLKAEQKYLEEVEAAQRAFNISFEEYMGLLANAQRNKELRLKTIDEKATVAALKKVNDEYTKFLSDIAGAISENIVNGGKDGSAKLRGIIQAELAKPITIFINAVIQDIFGGTKSGKSLSESFSSMQSSLNIANSFSKGGLKGAQFLSDLGFDTASEMLGQFSAGMQSGTSSLGGFKASFEAGGANMAGAIAGSVLNGISGYGISKSLSGGFKVEGINVDAIAGIASMIPGVGPIAGVIGGIINRAFGMAAKEQVDAGVRGSVSAKMGANLESYSSWKQEGGWFRSDRQGTDVTAITGEFDQLLDSSINSVSMAVTKYADILKLSTGHISGFTKYIDLSLKGLSPEEQKKKIEEALGSFGDNLANTLGFESMQALEQFASQILDQRISLENKLLELQGNTTELRAREREKIHETNLSLYDQIIALQDMKAAAQELTTELGNATSAITDLFSELTSSIASERANVSQAIAGLGPQGVKTAQELRDSISKTMTNAPSSANVTSTSAALKAAYSDLQSKLDLKTSAENAKKLADDASKKVTDANSIYLAAYDNLTAQKKILSTIPSEIEIDPAWWKRNYWITNSAYTAQADVVNAAQKTVNAAYVSFLDAQDAYSNLMGSRWFPTETGTLVMNLTKYTEDYNTALTTKSTAEKAATDAQIAYAGALRTYIDDAGKSVKKLSQLREETVAYYEAQKQLADGMIASAANIREAIASVRSSQITNEQSLRERRVAFDFNAMMAMSTTGSTQISYADKLAEALPGLSDSIREVSSTRAEWAISTAKLLSKSESVAKQLELNAPTDYIKISADILASIDSTLVTLEASTASAEKVISDAINDSSLKNLNGLRAVIAAIQGKAIPAFASGGSYSGGLALVGENGPELINFNQSGQIYNASQTSAMLSDTSAVVDAVNRLNENIDGLRIEMRADVSYNSKISKLLERVTPDGESLSVTANFDGGQV